MKKLTSGGEIFLWLYGANICGLMSKLLFQTSPDIWVESFVMNPQFLVPSGKSNLLFHGNGYFMAKPQRHF